MERVVGGLVKRGDVEGCVPGIVSICMHAHVCMYVCTYVLCIRIIYIWRVRKATNWGGGRRFAGVERCYSNTYLTDFTRNHRRECRSHSISNHQQSSSIIINHHQPSAKRERVKERGSVQKKSRSIGFTTSWRNRYIKETYKYSDGTDMIGAATTIAHYKKTLT